MTISTAWTNPIGLTGWREVGGITVGFDGTIYVTGTTTGSVLNGQKNNGAYDTFLIKYSTDGNTITTKLFGSPYNEFGKSIATGLDGSIYVGGYASNSLDGQLVLGGDYDALLVKYSPDGTKLWTRTVGGNGAEMVSAIAPARDGSIYIAGETNSLNIDGKNNNGTPPRYDAFITKYSLDGTRLWTQVFGGSQYEYPRGLASAADGSVYMCGFTNSPTFEGNPTNGADAFITKFAEDGTKLWSRVLGGSGSEEAWSLTIGLDGSIYVCGTSSSTLLDGVTQAAGSFIVKYQPDGTKSWTKVIPDCTPLSIKTGLDGSIYVAGTGNLLSNVDSSLGVGDVLLARYLPDGTNSWTKYLGGTGFDSAKGVAIGLDGSLYLAGTSDSTTFNGLTLVQSDGFVLKIPADSALPKVVITGNKSVLAANQTATITFTLSAQSVDFDITDVSVVGGNLSGFSGGGQSYTAQFTPTTTGPTNAQISVIDGAFHNATGASNSRSNTLDFLIDTFPPSIAISANSSNLSVGQVANLTFTVSERTTDFDQSDLTISGGAISNFTGSGTNYTATFVPTANSTANGVISVANSRFSDFFGNLNVDGADSNNTVNLSVDTLPPTISLASNKAKVGVGETAGLTFTLSETSNDFIATDLTVTGGSLSNFSGSGTLYSATFTPTTNSSSSGVVTVSSGKFSDAANNFNVDGTDTNNTITIAVDTLVDTIPPTISLSSSRSSLASGDSANLKFILSESSNDFTIGDVTVTGGTLSNFSGSGAIYYATFTPAAVVVNPVQVSVASNKFSDAAGNPNVDGLDSDNSLSIPIGGLLAPYTVIYGSGQNFAYAIPTANPSLYQVVAVIVGGPTGNGGYVTSGEFWGKAIDGASNPRYGIWIQTDIGNHTGFYDVTNNLMILPGRPLTATYTLSSQMATVSEGSGLVFTLSYQSAPSNTIVPIALSGPGISEADFKGRTLISNINLGNTGQTGVGQFSFTLDVVADSMSEGSEMLTVSAPGTSVQVSLYDTQTLSNVICFAGGTLIQTAFGPVMVEELQCGDLLSFYVQPTSTEAAKVKWIGRQTFHPVMAELVDYLPIKISANALGPGQPFKDLYVSPDHAILFDGTLIHAKVLVNGTSILQVTEWAGDIEYFHIETENHELVYANGVPAETFIDNVSRRQFDNYAEFETMYPNAPMMTELDIPRVLFRRQLSTVTAQRLNALEEVWDARYRPTDAATESV